MCRAWLLAGVGAYVSGHTHARDMSSGIGKTYSLKSCASVDRVSSVS